MSRHLLTIHRNSDRDRAMHYVTTAPVGTRVEFKAAKRTLPQNDRMWAMLTDIAAQKRHCGRKYTPDQWKVIFLNALGREADFIPSLDEKTFVPIYSSSDLSKSEMSDMIELMLSWGAENGVTFHDKEAA